MINEFIAAGILMSVPAVPARAPEKDVQQERFVAVLPAESDPEDVSDDVSEDEFLRNV